MPKRMTNEEFLESVKDQLDKHDFVVLDDYINMRTKLRVLHNKCGKTHMKTGDSLKRGKGCPYCVDYSTRKNNNKTEKWTSDKFKDKVYKLVGNEFEVIGNFQGIGKNIKMKHQVCGNIINPKAYEFIKRGTRCGHCANKIQAFSHEDFLQKLKIKRNNEFEVLSTYYNNHTTIKIRHLQCGEIYETLPKAILQGTNCPYCSGRKNNIRTVGRKIKELVGDEYTLLTSELNNLNDEIKLIHNECGKLMKTTAISFIKGDRRCKKCRIEKNSLLRRKSHEQFVEEINDLFGDQYTILSIYKTAMSKVLVKHKHCGKTFDIVPNRLLSLNAGCPYCSQSSPETIIQNYLDNHNIINTYQYKFDDCLGKRKTKLPFDFAIFNKEGDLILLIEYDGEQHENPNAFGKESYERTKRNDNIKNDYCESRDINLIRINYREKDNIQEILDNIFEKSNTIDWRN